MFEIDDKAANIKVTVEVDEGKPLAGLKPATSLSASTVLPRIK